MTQISTNESNEKGNSNKDIPDSKLQDVSSKKQRFAFDSEGSKMAELFNTIEEIRKGSEGEDLKLPQMCVIGMQSSGKSSLLTSISGLSFPEASKTCTKCPIVVNLRKENNICLKVNNETLESDKPDEEKVDDQFEKLQDKIKELNDGNAEIADKPINIEYSDPNLFPLTLVDLPGIIISSDSGQKITHSIISKYVKPKNAIILVVQPANIDKDTTSALKIAREYDEDGSRTIEIYTKADEVVNEQNAVDIIAEINDQKNDLFSTHIVSCRDSKGGKHSYETEMDVFRQAKWQDSKFGELDLKNGNVGIRALREQKLPKLLADNIMHNLPLLEKDINKKLEDADKIIKDIGEKPMNPVSVISRLYESLKEGTVDLKLEITPHQLTASEDVYKISKAITQKDTDKYYQANCFEPIFFEGTVAFNKSIGDFSQKCLKIVEVVAEHVKKIAFKSINEHESMKYNKYTMLKDYILQKWTEEVDKIYHKLMEDIKKQVYDTSQFNTVNHYLTSNYQEEMSLPKEVREKFTASLNPTDAIKDKGYDSNCNEHHFGPISTEEYQKKINASLDKYLQEYYIEYSKKNIQDQQKQRVFSAVKAYVKTSRKVFDDQMLAIIRRVVVDARATWLNEFFMGNQELIQKVKEGKDIESKRKKAIKTKDSMELCRKKIMGIKHWQHESC